jgi:DNA uptake protein ComE-like DNA-binding protein
MRMKCSFTKVATAATALAVIALWGLSSPADAGQETNAPGASSSNASSSGAHAANSANHAPLDLNSATREQLRDLPGIGDAYAQKIIDGRPYQSRFDLLRKQVIPASTYRKISGMVVVRQNKPGKN